MWVESRIDIGGEMKKQVHTTTSCILVTLLFLILIRPPYVAAAELDDYVARPDSNYGYVKRYSFSGPGYTGHLLQMTSQAWLSPAEVNHHIWRHWVRIVVPDVLVDNNTALLAIMGGSHNDPQPPANAEDDAWFALGLIAFASRSVVVDVEAVPNEPLRFTDEGFYRSEDAIIAYSFDKFMTTGDPNWPVLLPMVKSAVSAMNASQDYLSKLATNPVFIDDYVVMGASKRGWTTWLTAAVDSRVKSIMPMVIDVLQMDRQMAHHFSAYGDYSSAIHDYVEKDIFSRLYTPEGRDLFKIVDPYRYLDRFTMPKIIINSSGDQFFLPDSSKFYFHDLPGPDTNYLQYIPNSSHGLVDGSDLFEVASVIILNYYNQLYGTPPLPGYSWEVQDDGAIVVHTTFRQPYQVNLWQATNHNARDFRLETIGAAYASTPLAEQSPGVYVAQVAEPDDGWTAFFVELVYKNTDYGFLDDEIYYFKFTTEISVVPDYMPYACEFNRDPENPVIDLQDITYLIGQWLATDDQFDEDVDFAEYADIAPSRSGGDGVVNLLDYGLCNRNINTGD